MTPGKKLFSLTRSKKKRGNISFQSYHGGIHDSNPVQEKNSGKTRDTKESCRELFPGRNRFFLEKICIPSKTKGKIDILVNIYT